MAKDLGSFASASTSIIRSKSKMNKMSKKRDALKKRNEKQADQMVSEQYQSNEESAGNNCKKFILIDDQHEMIVKPLQASVHSPPTEKDSDVGFTSCAFKIDLVLLSNSYDSDEYQVVNFEDEFDRDNLPNNEEEDDGTSQKRGHDFSPPHDDDMLHEELQHVTEQQGLSPRVLYQNNFKTKNTKRNIPITIGRPNTIAFASRSFQ